jgi:hypothetical protein
MNTQSQATAAQNAMRRLLIFLCLTLSFVALAAECLPPGKYSLSVGRVYESKTDHPEWVFIFGGTSAVRGGETVCRSPASLKALLKGLPRGCTLDWSPTCSGESGALAADLEDLKRICKDAGIAFTIHPAG